MERRLIITHSDADGIISAYLARKVFFNSPVVFSGPNNIAKAIDSVKNKKQKLVILDIAPSQAVLEKAKAFSEVLWIDHHESPAIKNIPGNAKIVVKKLPSTAEIVAEEFKIDNKKLVQIANEIDTNSVKSEDAGRIRDYVDYMRQTVQGILFKPLAKELMSRLDNFSNFLTHPEIALKVVAHKVQEKEKVESIKPDFVEVRAEKIAFVEPKSNVPIHEVFRRVNADYLVVFGRKRNGTKIEFRTHTKRNVLKIAEIFKGGGHLNAAGAFTDNKNVSNIRKKIVNFIKKKI